jgi:methylenetetrahydrofolate--tRNA-(uracil-5-)-methyltransferase
MNKGIYVNIIGAGLAGCEAAIAAASQGVKVRLFEMKPGRFSPAHSSPDFAELVCSNSLKAERIESASGLLKEEMKLLGSILMVCAEKSRVPAGGALAVDRSVFSKMVTKAIEINDNIEVVREEVKRIPTDAVTVIATGPLTDGALADAIKDRTGEYLSFFDAEAPILTAESIDVGKCFSAARYDRGDNDYLNCPMDKNQYESFYNALITAQRAPIRDFDVMNPKVYEGCMPVEVLAQRGHDTLRFGPMKPVGLTDPQTGHRPWAVVQLRAEDVNRTMFNIVGFQTNLKFGEQKRVFSMIPGLENAEFVRFGVMHRNTFIDSPNILASDCSMKKDNSVFFAGQIIGVEGYMESGASGIISGMNAARRAQGRDTFVLPNDTMIGALLNYSTSYAGKDFQPMGANFGILPKLEPPVRNKQDRYLQYSKRSIKVLTDYLQNLRTMEVEDENNR